MSLKRIEKKINSSFTFAKTINGLLKKAYELSQSFETLRSLYQFCSRSPGPLFVSFSPLFYTYIHKHTSKHQICLGYSFILFGLFSLSFFIFDFMFFCSSKEIVFSFLSSTSHSCFFLSFFSIFFFYFQNVNRFFWTLMRLGFL